MFGHTDVVRSFKLFPLVYMLRRAWFTQHSVALHSLLSNDPICPPLGVSDLRLMLLVCPCLHRVNLGSLCALDWRLSDCCDPEAT